MPLSFLRAIYLSFFYFVRVYITLWRDLYFALAFMLCTSLLLFNFQWPIPARSCGQLDYYTTSLFPCQYLFSNFLKSFFKVFSMSYAPRCGKLVYYTASLLVCQALFYIFSFFSENIQAFCQNWTSLGHFSHIYTAISFVFFPVLLISHRSYDIILIIS